MPMPLTSSRNSQLKPSTRRLNSRPSEGSHGIDVRSTPPSTTAGYSARVNARHASAVRNISQAAASRPRARSAKTSALPANGNQRRALCTTGGRARGGSRFYSPAPWNCAIVATMPWLQGILVAHAPGASLASPDPAHAPLGRLPGVGPRIAEKLAARGLETLQDLWLHLPRQYEDRTALTPIRDLRPGVTAQVEGEVVAVERGFRYRPMLRVAIVDDSRATLVLRFFHFRAAQVAQFAPGARVRCYGTSRPGQHGLEMVHPSYRVLGDDGEALDERLSPVYPAIEGVGPASVRRLVGAALDRLPDDTAL